MPNPLLQMSGLPPFTAIRPEHVEEAVDSMLAENRAAVERLLAANDRYSWDNLVEPLEALDDRLNRIWSPVSHLNSVLNSDALREAHNACLPKLSAYATEMGQNSRLYSAFQQIAEGEQFAALDPVQQRVIENALRDFRLAGVALPAAQKALYREKKQALSRLTSQFSDNVLDATNGWELLLNTPTRLTGLPDNSIALLRQNAEGNGLNGWRLTLDFPCYHAIITYADDRSLRETLYRAYATRASDQGPDAGRWDNSEVIEQILRLRHELSDLLGFQSYAERSLATKMAESPQEVIGFLRGLAGHSLELARRELDQLHAFAAEEHGMTELAAWDIPYYSEKLRLARYALSQETLRPYFPAAKVIEGMFEVVGRLFGLSIRERQGVEVWHPEVHFYEIYDRSGALRGRFYLDLYAREHKRGGAWMDECIRRRQLADGRLQSPVAYLTCNFAPPVGATPSLLTHGEVETLFHEFGHGLHHMLTRIDHTAVSGISGVPWDAVELPSQFLENWCWEREALALFSGHYLTGEPLPAELFDKMVAAKGFQAGMLMVRQLEFALFDFRLYHEYDPAQGGRVQQILDEVRAEVAVVQPPEDNRFQHGFSHIFAGGYAAGYYSYKWAEVLAADAFSRFEEEGVFSSAAGSAFLETILEQGGSRDPMALFVDFRGRKPTIDALLRQTGITA